MELQAWTHSGQKIMGTTSKSYNQFINPSDIQSSMYIFLKIFPQRWVGDQKPKSLMIYRVDL